MAKCKLISEEDSLRSAATQENMKRNEKVSVIKLWQIVRRKKEALNYGKL